MGLFSNIDTKKIAPTIRSYFRVLKLAKRPSTSEFLNIAKIAGVGIMAVGIMGFAVYILLVMLPQWIVSIKSTT